MSAMKNLSDRALRAAAGSIVDLMIKQSAENRNKNFLKLVDMAEHFWGDGFDASTYDTVRAAIADPDNKWVKFINKVLDETDPYVAKTTLLNLGYNAFFKGTKMIRENRKKYNCNIPWLILFDPTTACNMHCTGCWSGTYGHKFNLTYEDMDKIVTQGKELGIYLYMMTGGEPLVRKADVLKLAEKHNDVEFAFFTNSTLVDEDFCKEVVKRGNMTFLLSLEGTPETNDGRRGDGHYDKVMKAMDLFKKYGILFGTSICYTSANVEAVTSDDFFKLISEKGARYGFYFHYMPVGNNAAPELLPTMEQREYMINRIRSVRKNFDYEFYPMDFQNDGEFVGGCIAGGRNYFHINSAGDAEPCVFIHYSNMNIHDHSILEILQSPLFLAYHKGQPFNENHLRPCPMLENPQFLQKMVKETGAHSTDLESPESAEHLCGKCEHYAEHWAVEADRIWAEQKHNSANHYSNYARDNENENAAL